MNNNGLFIVFEGIDGSGKTTQLKRTKEYLTDRGCDVVETREPGGTAISESIREMLLNPANKNMSAECELLLYSAARAQHIAEVIAPALKEGKAVLCDRFSLSTIAYQGYGRGIDPDKIRNIHSAASLGVKPDLTLIIDVPAELAAERVSQSRNLPKDRLEQEKSDFFKKVRNGFLREAEGDRSIIVIDGRNTEDIVFDEVCTALETIL